MIMSFYVNGQRMMHAAVNTDPLRMREFEEEDTKRETYYGLKERDVPHIKVSGVNEIKHHYKVGEQIGEGAFGTVTAVTEKADNKCWAMKSITKKASGDRLELLNREIQVLKMISHPHIILLDKIFESPSKIFLVMEKCNDFAKIYNERKPFSENVAKKIVSELVDAVAYLHKYAIVHRDLKIENILMGENPEDPKDEYYVKLTDFGLSIAKWGAGTALLHEFCGTLYYIAPEIIVHRSYTQMCDMWSVGVILYMLVIGTYPFIGKTDEETRNEICNRELDFDGNHLSNSLKDLLPLLLVKDPVNRIRATEVLQHPWITNRKFSQQQTNILAKMKEWKAEMKLEVGQESDWICTSNTDLSVVRSSSKQPMALPKTNISFDKGKKRHSDGNKSPKRISK